MNKSIFDIRVVDVYFTSVYSNPRVFDTGSVAKISNSKQDAANATLRSETLRETVCDAIIANGGVREPFKMCKTFAMTDASNTVQSLVAYAM